MISREVTTNWLNNVLYDIYDTNSCSLFARLDLPDPFIHDDARLNMIGLQQTVRRSAQIEDSFQPPGQFKAEDIILWAGDGGSRFLPSAGLEQAADPFGIENLMGKVDGDK